MVPTTAIFPQEELLMLGCVSLFAYSLPHFLVLRTPKPASRQLITGCSEALLIDRTEVETDRPCRHLIGGNYKSAHPSSPHCYPGPPRSTAMGDTMTEKLHGYPETPGTLPTPHLPAGDPDPES